MCAPCKVIFDEGTAAAFRGEDVEAAMALASSRVLDQLSEEAQNAMIRLDHWYLQKTDWSGSDRADWRRRLIEILEKEAGFSFEADD